MIDGWLVHIDSKNRFFLRGYNDYDNDGSKLFYTDFLPYTKEIVSKSSDIFIMPEIPTPKTKIGERESYFNSLMDFKIP